MWDKNSKLIFKFVSRRSHSGLDKSSLVEQQWWEPDRRWSLTIWFIFKNKRLERLGKTDELMGEACRRASFLWTCTGRKLAVTPGDFLSARVQSTLAGAATPSGCPTFPTHTSFSFCEGTSYFLQPQACMVNHPCAIHNKTYMNPPELSSTSLSPSILWQQHIHNLRFAKQFSFFLNYSTSAHTLKLRLPPCCFTKNPNSTCFSSLKMMKFLPPRATFCVVLGLPFLFTYFPFDRMFIRRDIRQTIVVSLPSCLGIHSCQEPGSIPRYNLINLAGPSTYTGHC